MPENKNPADGVGQGAQYPDAVDKYDAEHGKYKDNVGPGLGGMPNQSPAAPDPSPFKVGPT